MESFIQNPYSEHKNTHNQTYSRIVQPYPGIFKTAWFWDIQNPGIFKTLAYLEPEAY